MEDRSNKKNWFKKNTFAIGFLSALLLFGLFAIVVAKLPGTATLAADALESQREDSTVSIAADETYGVVYVNDVAIASLASYDEAVSVRENVLLHYCSDKSEILSYEMEERIEAREIIGVPWNPLSVEGAVSLIVNGTEEVKTYTVESGDSMYSIASKVGMPFQELLLANPMATPSRLMVGQVLNIVEVKPMVHVTMTERQTVTEYVNYGTIYEGADSLYIGQFQLKSAGKRGENRVTYEITSVNGAEKSRTKTATEVISTPVSQVTYKGTKPLPNVLGTGVFRYPLDGYMTINSTYGIYRGAYYGVHKGIDLAGASGDNIYAVDDGAVTFAASSGTYGNLVKLSHGNGYETYYAHCSQILVSVGDTVKKGDVIALVGSTGRSTGPHLHFEVRVYGAVKNPLNYLP